jgi:hypothetical protein
MFGALLFGRVFTALAAKYRLNGKVLGLAGPSVLGDPFGRVRRLCHRPKHLKLLLHVERAPFLPRVHDHLPGFIVQLEPSFADIPLRIVSWTLPFLFQTTSRTIFDCLRVSRG